MKSITSICLALLAGGAVAHATSDTWDGSTSAVWATSANWLTDPAVVPGVGDTATFNSVTPFTTIDLGTGVTVSNLLFNTASVASYTLGSGAVGSQTLTVQTNGTIALGSAVTANQLVNANLALSGNGGTSLFGLNNDSAANLTVAGGISTPTAGIQVLRVAGAGNATISGTISPGSTGTINLVKTNVGTLTLSGGGTFSGGGVNSYLPGSSLGPVVLRQGVTRITSGNYTNTGEFVIGGVIANGGAGNNASLIMDAGLLNVSSWFSLGRGNGIGGVSSDVTLNNSAAIISANFSGGYNGGNAANLPKGTFTLNNNSSLNLNGNFNLAESAGSDMTMTLNNSAGLTNLSTTAKYIGQLGKGTLNINGNSSVAFGNATTYVGYRTGNGFLNVSGGTFTNTGNLQVGGSDASGTAYNATGTVTIANGTVSVGSMTVARGNNIQNTVSGTVTVNSGGTLNSEGDILLGFAGVGNLGKVVLNGGTINLATTTKRWLIMCQWDTSLSQFDVNSGLLRLNAGTDIRFSTGNNSGSNVFNLNGGAVTCYSDNGVTVGGTAVVDLQQGSGAGCINTFNLNGGTLSVAGVLSAQTTGTRIFNFNGGTLKAIAASTSFVNLGAGNATANVRDGGAVIDSNGKDITIPQALVHSTISGDAATDGGLTKTGNGNLTLSGSASYNGPTKVLGGTLSLNSSLGLPYGGDLVVSNAQLSLNAASGNLSINNLSAGSLTAATGASLSLAASAGSAAISAVGNLTLGNNTTISLAYGTLTANPSAAAITASGSLAKGTNIVINVSATGLGVGVFPLITVGSGTLNTNGFVLGTLPSGVKGVLVNNTSGSLDLQITSSGQLLSWRGANSDSSVALPNWDINTSLNWYDVGNNLVKYLQYSGNTIGDNVVFGDNGYNTDGTNHVNLATTVVPASVAFSSSMPYTLAGAGSIGGSTTVEVTNMNNSVFLANSNTYTGGTIVSSGSLIITNDSALGAAAGPLTLIGGAFQLADNVTSSRPITISSNATITVAAGKTAQLAGKLTGSSPLTKDDTGTLVLAGTNSYDGSPAVRAGTLQNSGSNSFDALVTVGNFAGNSAILNIVGGSFNASYTPGNAYNSSLSLGSAGLGASVLRMSGGTLWVSKQLAIGGGPSGGTYGGYTQSGGIATVGGFLALGLGGSQAGDQSVFSQSGGTFNMTNCAVTIGAVSTGVGVLSLSGNAAFVAAGDFGSSGAGVWVAENGQATLNVSGSASLMITNLGLQIGKNDTATAVGTVNLLGGVVNTRFVSKPGASATGYLNFNGGTLKASASSSTFISSLTAATVYSGGAKIDDGGFAVSFDQPLIAPVGGGVSAIEVADGGAGYVGAPVVTITGDGTNATAIAQVDTVSGKVTQIVITCPGFGYTYASASVTGGIDYYGAAASLGTVSITANTSGGLTKLGTGSLTMTSANSYAGPTVVSQGTLVISPVQQNTGNAVSLANATTLTITANGNSVTRIGNLTVGAAATDSANLSFLLPAGTNPASALLECGNLTLTGTNTIRVSGLLTSGTFPVLKYRGTLTGANHLNPVAATPHGYSGVVFNNAGDSTIYVTLSGAGGITWQGYNSSAALTNVWDTSTTNWLSGLSLSSYVEGDKAVFDDSGSGLVLLSNTVSPGGLVIANSTRNYTLQGPGQIGGVAGLAKLGTGSAIVNFAGNTFSGPTVISNGTLVATGGGAIGDSSAVTIPSASGTLVVSNAETIGSLAGNGNVVLAADLIAGRNNASTTLGGTVTGAGTFITTGTGTLTVSGPISAGGGVWVGSAAGDNSVMNIGPGGSVIASNWWVVGRSGATATVNINGGSLVHDVAGNLTLGTLGTTPKGTINLNSGSISNLVGETYLGEGSSAINYGVYNQSGGTAYLGNLYVGRSTGSGMGIGTVTITGGTMTTANLEIGFGNNNVRMGTNSMTMGAGATVNTTGFVRLGFAGTNYLWGMLTNNGGTLNVGSTALYLGYWDSCNGYLVQNSGQINVCSNASIIFGQNGNYSGVSTFDQNGGGVTFYSDAGTTIGGTGSLNLGNAGTGNYTYNLNGGTLTVPQIQKMSTTNVSTFNFNGGTLKAAGNSTSFMQGLNTASILAGGAVIDSSTYSIAIAQILSDDGNGGGLTKLGTGTLLLNGVNTYSGTTTVSNGVLSGIGTIVGPVVVKSAGTLAPGNPLGTLTVNGAVTFGGAVKMAVDRNSGAFTSSLLEAGSTPLAYAGTLVITNAGATLQAGDTFKLFNTSGGYSGSFTLVSQTPGSIVTWNTANLAVNGTITVTAVTPVIVTSPTITNSVSGNVLSLSWPAGQNWVLQVQTNSLSTGLGNNWVDVAGSTAISSTNITLNPAMPTVFYRLRN